MRTIECDRCGCEIGRCTEYELDTGNIDYGEPYWNDDYGGDIDGENFCFDCYNDVIAEQEAEEYADDEGAA